MIIKILPKGGLGMGGKPLVLNISQAILYYDDGTPVCCAAEYGQDGTLAVSMAGQEDFNRTLRNLGEAKTVIVNTLELPSPPKGAKLIAGPRPYV